MLKPGRTVPCTVPDGVAQLDAVRIRGQGTDLLGVDDERMRTAGGSRLQALGSPLWCGQRIMEILARGAELDWDAAGSPRARFVASCVSHLCDQAAAASFSRPSAQSCRLQSPLEPGIP